MDHAQIELIEGTNRDHSKSQFFTPAKLAVKLVEWAGIYERKMPMSGRPNPMRVLEPSAGNGAIVRPLVAAGAEVTAFELDARYTKDLASLLDPEEVNGTAIVPGDFLALADALGGSSDAWRFDLCVGNFPFHLDLTGEFTLHALEFAPRVCAIYPANFPYSEQREELWKQVRPTRIAHISKRPWPGATDYCALELVKAHEHFVDYERAAATSCSVEWWHEAWT